MSDETDGLELTRRRALGSLGAIGVAAAGAGAGTMAYFQDTESSTGNTVQAGTLDLTVSNSGDFDWHISGVAPGDGDGSTAFDNLSPTLSNVGSVEADHVEIDISNTAYEDANGDLASDDSGPESDTDPDSAAGMAEHIVVELFEYQDTSELTTTYVEDGSTTSEWDSSSADANGNGYIDLDDLAQLSGGSMMDGFDAPEPNDGTDTEFTLTVSLHEDMPNDYQGDVLETSITVALHQDSSQDI